MPRGRHPGVGGRHAYDVLGVAPDASAAEIKAAYQLKVQTAEKELHGGSLRKQLAGLNTAFEYAFAPFERADAAAKHPKSEQRAEVIITTIPFHLEGLTADLAAATGCTVVRGSVTFAYGEQVREVKLKGRSPDALNECERLATALSRRSLTAFDLASLAAEKAAQKAAAEKAKAKKKADAADAKARKKAAAEDTKAKKKDAAAEAKAVKKDIKKAKSLAAVKFCNEAAKKPLGTGKPLPKPVKRGAPLGSGRLLPKLKPPE